MEPKTKKILIIVLIVFIAIAVILALTLGLVFGLKKKDKDEEVEIVNSYDNTEVLIQKFPVNNPTTVQDGIEKKIQNRLLTGFENWNRGFDAWKKWGDILYTNASIYNVHGARLTLAQYQQSMDITLKKTNILMGDFHNMLICGNFTAIFYDIKTIVGEREVPGTVMEFVVFKDYGEELGTRVVVGWGGSKDSSFDSMRSFQGDEERMIQDEQIHLLLNYQIPTSGTLRQRYPILYPSEYLDTVKSDKFVDIIMEGFDKWNVELNAPNDYKDWLSTTYDADALIYGFDGKKDGLTLPKYKEAIDELAQKKTIKKLYFDNILIRDDWAALHYRYRSIDKQTNAIYVGDTMQFLKFKEVGNTYKIVGSWIK